MASSLPSPPSTPQPSTTTTSEPGPALASHLDDLLAQYLTLLDTYDTLRKQLSTDFSSGFLSLAHANRNATSTLGAGRRYGEEGFDGRMKALRGVRIEKTSLRMEADAIDEDNVATRGPSNQDPMHNETAVPQRKQPQPQPATDQDTVTQPTRENDELQHLSFSTLALTESNKKNDPLRWYGLFVPPPLRQCQSTFTSSVTNTIPSLLTTVNGMRAIEDEIWAVRDQLGMLEEYDYPSKKSNVPKDPVQEAEDQFSQSQGKQGSSSQPGLAKLASRSRPSEPRSRILKMD